MNGHSHRDSTESDRAETSTDGGLEFVNDMRIPLAGGRINLKSKLIVFQALFFSEADQMAAPMGMM